MTKVLLGLLAAIGVQGCMRERTLQAHTHHTHVKRQESNVTFPPILDANEQILLDSFDNTSISTWSYYYSALISELTRTVC